MIDEEMRIWVKELRDKIEKLEYCTYKRTKSGKSKVEKLRKEFEEMQWVIRKREENDTENK